MMREFTNVSKLGASRPSEFACSPSIFISTRDVTSALMLASSQNRNSHGFNISPHEYGLPLPWMTGFGITVGAAATLTGLLRY